MCRIECRSEIGDFNQKESLLNTNFSCGGPKFSFNIKE